jgi:hypothetical protein
MPNLTVTSRCDQTLYFDGKPFVFQKGERVTLPDNVANFFADKPDIVIERGKSPVPAAPPPPPAPNVPPQDNTPPPPLGDEPPPPLGDDPLSPAPNAPRKK